MSFQSPLGGSLLTDWQYMDGGWLCCLLYLSLFVRVLLG